jgi:hypothetical protein
MNNSSGTVIRPQAKNRLPRRALLPWLIVLAVIAAGISVSFMKFIPGRQTQPDYRQLVGSWGRLDGDYVLCISSINSDGTVQAGYFNPNPIHVAQANVRLQNKLIRLFIELRDVGYPGSRYELTYNPNQDMLEGVYFQAQIQQSYDVIFQRMK